MSEYPTLQLVQEIKLGSLLPDTSLAKRAEASGVLARDDQYFVVFDDETFVARICDSLQADKTNGLFGMAKTEGYEGITFNPAKQRYYLLVESQKKKDGTYLPEVYEYDEALNFVKSRPLDFQFVDDKKGFEALSHVRRDGQDYVVALCEGNRCRTGDEGKKPGGGRIHVFAKKKSCWSRVHKIKLPKTVLFKDYSGMSIDGHRVAVVSQQSSLLWVGEFDEDSWSWRSDGQTYQFPRTDHEKPKKRYGHVEGVDWLSASRVVVVSDRRKKGQKKRYSLTDESIHVFDLPD